MNSETNVYTPLTEFGRKLLHSIPRKVYLWLDSLGVDLAEFGNHQLGDKHLTWQFNEDEMHGTVTLNVAGERVASILWDLDLVDPTGTKSGIPLHEPLEQHLEEFIRIEHHIYEVLGDLDGKLREIRNAKAG